MIKPKAQAKPSPAPPASDLSPEQALQRLNRDFCSAVPQGARGGGYELQAGDPFAERSVEAPDGRYRVHGSDWLFDIVGKKLLAASLATAENKFGGDKVVEVPNG